MKNDDNRPSCLDKHTLFSPIGSAPITKKGYHDLLIETAQEYDRVTYGKRNSQEPAEIGFKQPETRSFFVCANVYGQVDKSSLSAFPEATETFERVFSAEYKTSLNRWGAMIEKRPALIYSFELEQAELERKGICDPDLRRALTSIIAGQMDALFAGSNAKITYGHGSGHNQNDEIMAFLPADADLKQLAKFEKVFATNINAAVSSFDGSWFKNQYNAILKDLEGKLQKHQKISPWTIEARKIIADMSCQILGTYIGRLQRTRVNSPGFSKPDLAGLPSVLSRVTSSGIKLAEAALSKQVSLYTKPATTDEKAESFKVSLGQLYLAMEKMGYDKDYPVSDFLTNYSFETARDVKEIVEDLPKVALSDMIDAANTRSSTSRKPEVTGRLPEHE